MAKNYEAGDRYDNAIIKSFVFLEIADGVSVRHNRLE